MLQPNINNETEWSKTAGWIWWPTVFPVKNTLREISTSLQESTAEDQFKYLIKNGNNKWVIEYLEGLYDSESFHVLWKECFLWFTNNLNLFKEDLIYYDRYWLGFLQLFSWLDNEVVDKILGYAKNETQSEFLAKRILMNIRSFDRINIKHLTEKYDIFKNIGVIQECRDAMKAMLNLIWNWYDLEGINEIFSSIISENDRKNLWYEGSDFNNRLNGYVVVLTKAEIELIIDEISVKTLMSKQRLPICKSLAFKLLDVLDRQKQPVKLGQQTKLPEKWRIKWWVKSMVMRLVTWSAGRPEIYPDKLSSEDIEMIVNELTEITWDTKERLTINYIKWRILKKYHREKK